MDCLERKLLSLGPSITSSKRLPDTMQYDKQNLYGNSFEDSGNSQYVSYAIEDDLSIGAGTIITAGGDCTERSIFVTPSNVSPYAVYGTPFGACGTVMSVTDGVLTESIQEYNYSTSSGVHGLAFNPAGTMIYSFDDTGNAIWVHSIDNSTGELTYVADVAAPVEGADPRHGAVHPAGGYLYAVHEGTNEVGVYSIDQTTGILSYANASFSLIPEGKTFMLTSPDLKSLTTCRCQQL